MIMQAAELDDIMGQRWCIYYMNDRAVLTDDGTDVCECPHADIAARLVDLHNMNLMEGAIAEMVEEA